MQLVALDFSGHPDALIVPILAWLRVHQPELADNPEQRAKAFRFEAEYLNRQAVDLSIELDLTERVIVTRKPAGNQPDPLTTFERWEVRHAGELVATWTIEPERV